MIFTFQLKMHHKAFDGRALPEQAVELQLAAGDLVSSITVGQTRCVTPNLTKRKYGYILPGSRFHASPHHNFTTAVIKRLHIVYYPPPPVGEAGDIVTSSCSSVRMYVTLLLFT